ncbi:nucleotidyltransferase domain-containing protein [Phytohabitans rumicis]|uniref:nucleotidyltransferase domain-containing protein n=1 Tax=Phytohabitans rumicis TaxID=1076125 RepID=UPI0031EB8548
MRHDDAVIELPVLDTGFLGDWVDRLRTSTGPPVVGVLLRGSYARDEATTYSDVDLDVLVDGPPRQSYPAYLVEAGGRLVHLSVAVSDTTSWYAHVSAPADWAFGLPVVAPARLLWAAEEWRDRLDVTEIRQPAGDPALEDLVAGLGKVAGAYAAGDDLGARFAATDLARLCPSVLRLANPAVTVAGRRSALDAALGFRVAPAGYRDDMLTCLGLAAAAPFQVYAAARRLVTGTVTLIRPYANQLAPTAGEDLAGALLDGRLPRYLSQLTPTPSPVPAF